MLSTTANIGYTHRDGGGDQRGPQLQRPQPGDVSVTNTDNDTVGDHRDADSGLTTTEAGGTATFTVMLNGQPTA